MEALKNGYYNLYPPVGLCLFVCCALDCYPMDQTSKMRVFNMLRSLCIAASVVALSGCQLAQPVSCDVGYTHGSHPTLGPPFGPESEEGTIDLIGPGCRWESGRVTFDSSANYKIPDSDLYGNDFVFIGRVAYKIWERQ